METTQFIKRVRDKFRVSLLAKISLSIVLFFIIIVTSNIFEVSFVCKRVLGDYFNHQMHEKIESHRGFTEKALMDLNNFVGQMPIVFPELGQKIVENDFDYIIQTAKQTSTLMSNDGYVITDAIGNIKYNSYQTKCTRKQLTEFGDFVDWLCAKEDMTYNGYVNFLDQGICLVTAHVLPNMETGEPVGTFIVVQLRATDNDYLKRNSEMLQLSGQTVYEGTTLVGSSVFAGQETVHMELEDPSIADSVYQHQKVMLTVENYGKDTYFSAYSPIIGYTGDVIGISNMAEDVSVMNSIVKTIGSTVLVLALLIGAVLLSFIIRFFRKNITEYIKRVTQTVRSIADGNLTEEVLQPQTSDEIAQLCQGVRDMQKSLSDTILSISQTADLLHSSSEGLSKSSFQLSDGATKQASSLEQISSSLQQMASNIHLNKDNACLTEQQMAAADDAVQRIADSASDSMNETQRIATSIAAINELVSQTNILSLNASVEAARAGNMGKGFGVVAREVGRLAEQTKITASDISEKAGKSIVGAQNINSLLDEVSPQLHKVSALVKEIAVSSQEQSIGADQINIAVLDLNNVTQETALSAKHIASNADELSLTSEKLRQIVSTFKLT
ncbi:MAG: methyl-accepting chemotaxis protein [Bacteroidales bacterium]|nr:methyl-accepting chemotaxis protein [Bacteroidales bacterium]